MLSARGRLRSIPGGLVTAEPIVHIEGTEDEEPRASPEAKQVRDDLAGAKEGHRTQRAGIRGERSAPNKLGARRQSEIVDRDIDPVCVGRGRDFSSCPNETADALGRPRRARPRSLHALAPLRASRFRRPGDFRAARGARGGAGKRRTCPWLLRATPARRRTTPRRPRFRRPRGRTPRPRRRPHRPRRSCP
jgi:hypothetical protein